MYTEIEVWNLFFLALLANAAYFVGIAFLIWVSFRAANQVGGSDNMINKILVSIFCLFIVLNMNGNDAMGEWIANSTAQGFVALEASGTAISQNAQNFVAGFEPGKEYNMVPGPLQAIFMLTVLLMQMLSIWKKG